jgi:hypothetical protein
MSDVGCSLEDDGVNRQVTKGAGGITPARLGVLSREGPAAVPVRVDGTLVVRRIRFPGMTPHLPGLVILDRSVHSAHLGVPHERQDQ